MARPLTGKQLAFIDEYLVDFNATQAAIRAGYSEKAAHVQGFENIRNPKIIEVLALRAREVTEKADVTIKMVIDGLLLEAGRTGKDSSHSARVAAWAHLGKYMKMFADHVQHEHTGAVQVAVTRTIVDSAK